MEGLFCLCRESDQQEYDVYRGNEKQDWQLLPMPPVNNSKYRIICCDSKLLLLPQRAGHVYSLGRDDSLWEHKSSMPDKNGMFAVADRENNKIYVAAGILTNELELDGDHKLLSHVYDVVNDSWTLLPFQGGPSSLVFSIFLTPGKLHVRCGSDNYWALNLDTLNWVQLEDRYHIHWVNGVLFDTTFRYALFRWMLHTYDYEQDHLVPLQVQCEIGDNPTEYGPAEAEFFIVDCGGECTAYSLFWSHDGPYKELWKCVFRDHVVTSWWQRILLPPNCFQVCHLLAGEDTEDRTSLRPSSCRLCD